MYPKEHIPMRNNENRNFYQVLDIYMRDLKTYVMQLHEIYSTSEYWVLNNALTRTNGALTMQ